MKYDKSAAGKLTHSVTPGCHVITLPRAECTEHFITINSFEGEAPGAMFARAAQAASERDAQIISQDVFGLDCGGDAAGALGGAFGQIDWPVTWIQGDPRRHLAGTQLWAVSGAAVETIDLDGRVVGSVFEDGASRIFRLGDLRSADPARSREEQTQDTFEQMEAALALAGMSLEHVVRTWIYLDEILAWYREFNQVRDRFFSERGVFDSLVPASTGVGGRGSAGTALVANGLAMTTDGMTADAQAVPSPLQCPALEYGSSFNRAVEIAMGDHRRLFVSGTASIDAQGRTVHVGDVDAQISHTMDVVHAILTSRRMDWDDVTRSVVYFKRSEDVPAFEQYCDRHRVGPLPEVLVWADICREDLLFEIEVDAIAAGGEERRPDSPDSSAATSF